jgi:predicted PurR-regulated permease PerM
MFALIRKNRSNAQAAQDYLSDLNLAWRSRVIPRTLRENQPRSLQIQRWVENIECFCASPIMNEHERLRIGFPVAGSALPTVLLAVVLIAALYFAREVLVPIALALLLSFVLAPLVRRLRSWYLPRSVAVVFSVLVAFAVIFSLGALMVSQVTQLANDLPGYQSTLRDKIQSLRGAAAGTGTLERASAVLQELGKELDKPQRSGSPAVSLEADRAVPNKPIAVEVKQPDPGALQTLVALITPLIHPLTTTGVVIIFVIFILMQREDLRNRMIRLAGARDLQRTTAALDDAGQRLSRLFLAQLALNAGFGLVIGAGLWFIGVPSAPLWGILAMILRFVPYIGALISAIFPLILAAAVGPDWSMVLWTAALFLVVEPITGHLIEPLLTGQSTGLSPVAVVTSAAFWTWLWGPIGLVLATPLTMCMVVLGRHVDRLKFLDIMLGDEPALKPEELTYQRMLAGDPIEVAEQAHEILEEKPLLSYYQDVLVEALKLAQADADRGLLDDERKQRIRDVVAELLDDLETHEDTPELVPAENTGTTLPVSDDQANDASGTPAEMPEEWSLKKRVLCIPGRDLLGEAYALIVAQLLSKDGISARAEHSDALSMSKIFSLDTQDVEVICLCFGGDATRAQVHYAVRRLRRKMPEAFILLTLIGNSADFDEQFRASAGIGSIQNSLSGTREEILRVVKDFGKRIEMQTTLKIAG